MSIPESLVQRDTVAAYVKEYVGEMRNADLVKSRQKDIKDAVKESELIDPKEFLLICKASYDIQKLQEEVDVKSEAIANLEILGL